MLKKRKINEEVENAKKQIEYRLGVRRKVADLREKLSKRKQDEAGADQINQSLEEGEIVSSDNEGEPRQKAPR